MLFGRKGLHPQENERLNSVDLAAGEVDNKDQLEQTSGLTILQSGIGPCVDSCSFCVHVVGEPPPCSIPSQRQKTVLSAYHVLCRSSKLKPQQQAGQVEIGPLLIRKLEETFIFTFRGEPQHCLCQF
ncbi:hypothetical protein STEG23_030094 [Scotinomys teguina]